MSRTMNGSLLVNVHGLRDKSIKGREKGQALGGPTTPEECRPHWSLAMLRPCEVMEGQQNYGEVTSHMQTEAGDLDWGCVTGRMIKGGGMVGSQQIGE